MPLTSLTCPICLAVLKTKAPVPEGARVRCPKCKGSFVAEGAPKAEEHEPDLAQEPMPEAADQPAEEEPEEAVEVVEEVTDAPPTPKRRNQERDDENDRPRKNRARDDEDEVEEDRPRRKKKRTKGGLPLWAWFAIGGGGLVLLCGCCGIPGAIFALRTLSGMSVNMDNYNKLQRNMTEAQVKVILGEPTQSVGFFGSQAETWTSGDYFITVTFQNGKAAGKSCHLPFGIGTIDRNELLWP